MYVWEPIIADVIAITNFMTNQKIAVYRTKLTECKLGNKFYNIHQAELKIWMRLLLSDGCSN